MYLGSRGLFVKHVRVYIALAEIVEGLLSRHKPDLLFVRHVGVPVTWKKYSRSELIADLITIGSTRWTWPESSRSSPVSPSVRDLTVTPCTATRLASSAPWTYSRYRSMVRTAPRCLARWPKQLCSVDVPHRPLLTAHTQASYVCGMATYWSRPVPTHTCSVCLYGHLLVRACTHPPTHTYSVCVHGHLLVQACAHPHMFRVSAWPPTGPGLHTPTHVPCVCMATHWSRPAPIHTCSVCVHGHLPIQACTHPPTHVPCVCTATHWSRHAPTHTCVCMVTNLSRPAPTHPCSVSAWPPTAPGMRPPTRVPCVCMATYWSRTAPTRKCSLCVHGHPLV